ncbi:MAG TPA: OmpA family protein [Patescibacteria group bacterium]|nr:OmpA family protein [Patescibacteria group bacterium]
MKPIVKIAGVALLSLFLKTSVQAQESRPAYGIYGDGAYNLHQADFRALPGVPNCCERFSSGSGAGMSLGFVYQLPFLKDDLFINLRAGYNSLSAVLTRIEQTTVTGNVPGEFEHRLEATLSSVSLEPLIGYRLFKNFSLQGGLSAGYLLQKGFHQRETILSPDNGTFLNEQARYRNDSSGDIPNAQSMALGLVGGMSYTLPMNSSRTLLLSPELLFNYSLTDFVDGLSWKGHAVRLGASIMYSPEAAPATLPPKEEPVIPVEPPPVIIAEAPPAAAKPQLTAMLSAVGVDASGIEVPNVTLRVEEFLSTQMKPLLPYIFFKESSSEMPERYKRMSRGEQSSFTIDKLGQLNTLETYYNLLNIVGRRLQDNPQAKLTLTGTNDNTLEKDGGQQLSAKRAEAVRDYLIQTWNIDTKRIAIETRDLPQKPSNTAEPDGLEENRRVELASDDWKILEPVITNDTLRQANPPTLRIRPSAGAEAGLARWTIAVEQSPANLLKEFTGEGTLPPVLDWTIAEEQGRPFNNSSQLTVSLDVQDAASQSAIAQKVNVPMNFISLQTKRRERIADKEIDRFSLILFDFDKATLSTANQRIAAMIKPYIKPASTVSVTGYTDRMGDATYNEQLSRQRAQASAQALQIKNAQTAGLGESNLLYDNSLPEGRFYSRTVNIVIETPVGK